MNAPRRSNPHYHGEPCTKCRATLRYASTRNCVACAKSASRVRRSLRTHEDQAFDLIGNIKDYE